MSVLAHEQRRHRRGWAAAGSSHDRLIAILRIVLPTAIGVLAAFLALAPITVGRDISFVLSKNRVDVASERMRVSRAIYRGRDGKDQPFQLNAASAVQVSSRDPIVHLRQLDAKIQLTGGPATIVAGQGRYDMDTDRIALDGPVKIDDSEGYQILTRNILLDMKTRVAVSRAPVEGTMPTGRFSADHMRARLDDRIINLDGRVHLHIVQRRGRARAA